jgi:predicted RNase H-related nuclease YkuK (DUF458 family)
MKQWRCKHDGQRYDLISYTKKYLGENSNKDVNIYVGCDSQNVKKRKFTGYVTCVAFHFGSSNIDGFSGQGVHIIFKAEKYKRISDKFSRLWKEAEKSLAVAEQLRKHNILISRIDLDYNNDEAHLSNRLVKGGEGMIRGLGYNVASKPEELLASRAADHLIHTINWKSVKIQE